MEGSVSEVPNQTSAKSLHVNGTSVLSFSSCDERDNKLQVDNNARSAKSDKKQSLEPLRLVIGTRDGPVTTDINKLIKFKIVGEGESYFQNSEQLWLDFKSSEVHDFLDVIAGRKQYLRQTEHVEEIAKVLSVDLKLIDEEYNKLANLIRESIIIEIYKIFPAGKITFYNQRLILCPHHQLKNTPYSPLGTKCYYPGISLKNSINDDIRSQLGKCTKHVQEYIWKRVNSSGIPLKKGDTSINIKLSTDINFCEYWLIYNSQ